MLRRDGDTFFLGTAMFVSHKTGGLAAHAKAPDLASAYRRRRAANLARAANGRSSTSSTSASATPLNSAPGLRG